MNPLLHVKVAVVPGSNNDDVEEMRPLTRGPGLGQFNAEIRNSFLLKHTFDCLRMLAKQSSKRRKIGRHTLKQTFIVCQSERLFGILSISSFFLSSGDPFACSSVCPSQLT